MEEEVRSSGWIWGATTSLWFSPSTVLSPYLHLLFTITLYEVTVTVIPILQIGTCSTERGCIFPQATQPVSGRAELQPSVCQILCSSSGLS